VIFAETARAVTTSATVPSAAHSRGLRRSPNPAIAISSRKTRLATRIGMAMASGTLSRSLLSMHSPVRTTTRPASQRRLRRSRPAEWNGRALDS
jgi:hypothetical protein